MGFNSLRSSVLSSFALAAVAISPACTSETPSTCSSTISANVSTQIHQALATMQKITGAPQAHVSRGNFLIDPDGKYFGDTNAIISGNSFVACEKNKNGEAGSCWTGTVGQPGDDFTHITNGGSVSFDAHNISYGPPTNNPLQWIQMSQASCTAFDGKVQSDQCAEDCANQFSTSRDAIKEQLGAF